MSSEPVRVGVYICHCGTNISEKVRIEEVRRSAEALPEVSVARDYQYMCSEPGQALIQEDIQAGLVNRVVVASCSPRMHEPTFRKAVAEAGLNGYLFEMANIREHCSWCTEESSWATRKARALVTSAVRKAAHLEPLEERLAPVNPNVLVVGGGIAGIESSLKLANAGYHVYLVEREPSIGGHMAQLDKTFPTLDCAACILTPKMNDVRQHPNITLMSYSEIEQVEGFVGSFRVRVKHKPRYVDEDACNGCGKCWNTCLSRPFPTKRVIKKGDELISQTV